MEVGQIPLTHTQKDKEWYIHFNSYRCITHTTSSERMSGRRKRKRGYQNPGNRKDHFVHIKMIGVDVRKGKKRSVSVRNGPSSVEIGADMGSTFETRRERGAGCIQSDSSFGSSHPEITSASNPRGAEERVASNRGCYVFTAAESR
jgi:hypothetical protein